MNIQSLIILALIIIGGLIFRLFIILNLQLPFNIILLTGLVNILLTYFIVRKFFSTTYANITTIIYAFLPWGAYVDVSGSISILITLVMLFLILVIAYNQKFQTFTWLLVVTIFFISFLLFYLNFLDKGGNIFSDPGYINSVNVNQGEDRVTKFKYIGKIVENKFSYGFEFISYNLFSNLSPVTYFTPQTKLLGFSFTPPIYISLIIPFILGLVLLTKKSKYVYLVGLFTIPSVFANKSPDLNKLVILLPFFCLFIACGIIYLSKIRLKSIVLVNFILSLLLVIQIITTLQDIFTKESVRYQNYITQK